MVWEERWHPLRREWVIVSSHRNDRPWLGETVDEGRETEAPYDPTCYLCPRNTRISGKTNPDYQSVYVFDNDHPCVGPDAPAELEAVPSVYQSRRANGIARVVCYTPRHDLTLAELTQPEIVRLLETFREQYLELGDRPEVRHVLSFENKGEVVGVSNPHPHAQIYATNFVFRTIETEVQASAEHLAEHGRPLLRDVIEAE
jgi:UDPglucose--hexose-1-phosphate uridylyltransferase